MIKLLPLNKVFIYLLASLAFFIPLIPKVLPIIIIAIIVARLISAAVSFNNQKFILNKKFFYLVCLWFLYLAGLIYTDSDNLTYGFKDIETKLSLLIFPLLFASYSLSSAERNKVFFAFVGGVFTAMVFNVTGSLIQFYSEYTRTGNLNFNYFLYFNLSKTIHPSYMAMYFCLAVVLMIQWIHDRSLGISAVKLYVGVTLLVLFIFMLSSKAGILTLILILIYYLIVFAKRIKSPIRLFLPAAMLLISVMLYLFVVPGATSRLEINPSLLATNIEIAKDTQDSSELRVLIWQKTIELIKNNFLFGVGTGDVKSTLIDKYKSDGITWAAHFQLNAHNQFLQTWLAIGLFGFLSLLSWIFLPLLKGIFHNNHTLILFGLIILLNFLFESMLETQAGVIFIALFSSLFVFYSKDTVVVQS